MKYKITLFVAVSLILVACTKEATTIKEILDQSGCAAVGEATEGKNMFNAKSIKCSGESRVYWYPTPESQENHGKACAGFGGKEIKKGKYWTLFKPSC